MTDTASARLALPFIDGAQAQKEITHNEALAMLDIAVQAAVEAAGLDEPPMEPAPGACWIVGSAPVGAWTGQAEAIAGWTTAGWRFVSPRDGMRVWDRASLRTVTRIAGTWDDGAVHGTRVLLNGIQVLGTQRPAIADPSDGAVVDAPGRAAIVAILASLRAHGLIAS